MSAATPFPLASLLAADAYVERHPAPRALAPRAADRASDVDEAPLAEVIDLPVAAARRRRLFALLRPGAGHSA